VKFLVAAQLPARLARFLSGAGRRARPTVIAKDRDFRDGYLLATSPQRLLIVATGNVSNGALLSMFETHLGAILTALAEADFVDSVRIL